MIPRYVIAVLVVLFWWSSLVTADENLVTTPAKDFELRVKDQPVVQRGFLPESSARSIAVGLPGGISYCFDTQSCSLRYAWTGGFLNMKPTWHARGAAPPVLMGAKFFTAPDAMSWRIGTRDAKLRFLGYTLEKGRPEFRFTVEGVEVKERVDSAGNGLSCSFELGETPREVLFKVPSGVRAHLAGQDPPKDVQGWVQIPAGAPTHFSVFIPGPQDPATTFNER